MMSICVIISNVSRRLYVNCSSCQSCKIYIFFYSFHTSNLSVDIIFVCLSLIWVADNSALFVTVFCKFLPILSFIAKFSYMYFLLSCYCKLVPYTTVFSLLLRLFLHLFVFTINYSAWLVSLTCLATLRRRLRCPESQRDSTPSSEAVPSSAALLLK